MTFTAFLLAAIVLAITPGPGLAYVVARTVADGRAHGMASCLGAALGGMVHVVAAALGLSLVIAQSALLFNLMKYVGAAYLVYLGMRMLVQSSRRSQAAIREVHKPAVDERQALTTQQGPVVQVATAPRRSVLRTFLEGIVVDILNVKLALFFLAFLPQFVDPAQSLPPQFALLGSICIVLNAVVDVVAVTLAHRLVHSSTARAGRARLLTRLSGCTMLGLGVLLALGERTA